MVCCTIIWEEADLVFACGVIVSQEVKESAITSAVEVFV